MSGLPQTAKQELLLPLTLPKDKEKRSKIPLPPRSPFLAVRKHRHINNRPDAERRFHK
ncbi:MAG: hypothetical protein KatS3mg105_0461 [Gemmatales bacterium]|nr:MAG: hypothetical protein KatS3mg105_0461 [Gemmatales bacterium]